MQHIFINADQEELVAWMSGTPKQVVALPPPKRTTKTFVANVLRRDVVVLPAAMFSNVRSEP